MTRQPLRAHARLSVGVPLATIFALGLILGTLAPLPGAGGSAFAQDGEGFALNRFNPSGGGSDWFTLESLDLRGQLRPALGLSFDFAHKPLVLYNADGEEVASIVERQIFLHVGAALNLAGRLRLGLSFPVAVNQLGEEQRVNGITYLGPSGAAAGDLRAAADVRLLGEYGDPFRLAIGLEAFFPTGSQAAYTGDGLVRVAPRLLAAGDAGMVAYALRVGFQTRTTIEADQFQGVAFGNELTGAVAVGLRPTPNFLFGPELHGSSVVTKGSFFQQRATPLEVIIGAHLVVADDWRFSVGGAPGLTQGIGSPQVRMLARLEYFPAVPPPDRDGDGILDPDDACPDTPGIRTGDPRTHGCPPPPPPPDRDGDGIIDSEDACPDEPGVRTGDPKTHGCPPPKDRDGDGIMDPDDACPDEPGEPTGDPKTHGCPPPDRDKDGVLDRDDACPDQPGLKTGDPKTHGCPDSDGDGIPDPEDACPQQPGPRDPDPKKHGCPVARVEKGQIRILDQVKFKSGSAVILPESDGILEAVANVLRENPEIKKVRVEGHTDNRGGRAFNKRLSDRRAASVVKWLTTRGGIERSRLTSQGFGFDRPIATNRTEEGRQENRRVEFHIVDPPPTE
jgi:OmpA-OmpF porin, OOP family